MRQTLDLSMQPSYPSFSNRVVESFREFLDHAWSLSSAEVLPQVEPKLHADPNIDGLAVFCARLELPLGECVHGALVQAVPQRLDNFDIGNRPVSRYHRAEHYLSLDASFTRFGRVVGLNVLHSEGCRHTVTDGIHVVLARGSR